MLSEEKKKRISELTIEEMQYEINLGRQSRFQREAFAFLKTCYQAKVDQAAKIQHDETVEMSQRQVSVAEVSNKHQSYYSKRNYILTALAILAAIAIGLLQTFGGKP